MALRNCLIVILLALVTKAHAVEPRLGQSWLFFVQSLQENGIEQIGDLNLETFKSQAREIQWQQVSPEQIDEIAEGRRSAYYLVREKEVFISTDIPKDTDHAVLELHEALGAVGYNDRSYNLSSALVTLAKTPEGQVRKKLVQGFGATVFTKKQMLASGSGSSVGGGGDLIALTAKNQFVELMLKDSRWHDPRTLAYLMQVNFEPFYDPDQQFVALRYLTNAAKGIGFSPLEVAEIPGTVTNASSGLQEQITFYVPALKWWKESERRSAVIAEAALTAQYVIPVTKKFGGTLTKYSCRGQDLYFQKDPTNHLLAMIQKSRVAVLAGCTDDTALLTEARYPQFVDYLGNQKTERVLPPEEASRLVLGTCSFLVKDQVVSQFDNFFYKGNADMMVFSVRLDPKRDLIGIVTVNEEAAIVALEMKTLGSKTKKHLNKKVVLQTPLRSASLSMPTFSGFDIEFKCENDLGKGRP